MKKIKITDKRYDGEMAKVFEIEESEEGGYSVVVNDILFSVLKIEIDGKEIEFYSSI